MEADSRLDQQKLLLALSTGKLEQVGLGIDVVDVLQPLSHQLSLKLTHNGCHIQGRESSLHLLSSLMMTDTSNPSQGFPESSLAVVLQTLDWSMVSLFKSQRELLAELERLQAGEFWLRQVETPCACHTRLKFQSEMEILAQSSDTMWSPDPHLARLVRIKKRLTTLASVQGRTSVRLSRLQASLLS